MNISATVETFAKLLELEISRGLPGTEAQWKMVSSPRLLKNFPKSPGPDTRAAAVLILLYPYRGNISTVLMQRPDYEGVHSGQISFPGGKQEPSDKSIVYTALREACEETGVSPETVKVIGVLTPLFIPVSNMLVTPVVGWTEMKPDFSHKKDEVVFLFDAEIKKLADPETVKMKPFEIRGEMAEIRYFDYEGHVIWGATAMMLNEFLEIIRRGHLSLTG